MKSNHSPEPVADDVMVRYQDLVNRLIAFRLKIMALTCAVLYMAYSYVDRLIYPNYQEIFLWMRVAVCATLVGICGLSYSKKFLQFSVWLVNTSVIVAAAGICFIIFKTDGASSRYYEGLYLIFWATIITNTYYYKHNVFSGCVILALYVISALLNPSGWNLVKFSYASFLLGVTVFFICVMTKFYGGEHLRGFLASEGLKRSEKRLAESNSKLSVLYNEADEMSKIDDLTKICNRRYFFEILQNKIKLCKEMGTFFYLVIFDIDHFKQINDTYGHTFGDQVIISVAQVVRDNIRPKSYIGRYGGDEFMIIIDKAEKEVLLSRLNQIRGIIRNLALTHKGEPVHISVSFGAAKVDPQKETTIAHAVVLADEALLEVKRTGRGEIRLANQ